MIFSALHYGDEFESWTARAEVDSVSDTAGSHARFAKLYLRSRLGGYAVLGLAIAAFLGWLSARLLQSSAYEIPGRVIDEILTVAALVVPLLAASAIGVSARSPFGEEEAIASRSMPAVRVCHLGGLLVCGIVMLRIAALSWDLDDAGWILTRNLSGLTGLTLITARVLGSGLSWVGPFAYGALCIAVNILSDHPPKGEWTRWVYWPLQPAADASSIAVAAVLLTIGIGCACWYTPRPQEVPQ